MGTKKLQYYQKHNKINILKILFFIYLFFNLNSIIGQTKSFPEAEGYGKYTLGGRGGEVLYVTNLNNSGVGSLRAACEASGARTVIFRVSGIINLSSSIKIVSPFLTIAGQSAPGDGILLKNDGGGEELLRVEAHDVIIRYIKLRRGPGQSGEANGDCLTIANFHNQPLYNVMVDHVSASWSTDETISTWYDTRDVTIQNCFIAEPLHFSTHSGTLPHSKAFIFGDHSSNITFFRNISAHAAERNPLCYTIDGNTAKFQIVNNLIYNWGYFGIALGYSSGIVKSDVIGNYIKNGPDTATSRYEVRVEKNYSHLTKIYVEDNIGHRRTTTGDPNTEWDIVGESHTEAATGNFRSMTTLTSDMPLPIIPVMDAYNLLLQDAGASKRMNEFGAWEDNRDSVDIRVVNDITTNGPSEIRNPGTPDGDYHGIIDHPSEVGGWPVYDTTATPYPDNDQDGMSDTWETANGFDPSDDSDRNADADADGYTNLEEFLNGSDPGSTASVSGHSNRDKINIYPNPTTGIIHLAKISDWELFSIQGGLILRGNGDKIDLKDYTSGIYFLKLNNGSKQIIKIDK